MKVSRLKIGIKKHLQRSPSLRGTPLKGGKLRKAAQSQFRRLGACAIRGVLSKRSKGKRKKRVPWPVPCPFGVGTRENGRFVNFHENKGVHGRR